MIHNKGSFFHYSEWRISTKWYAWGWAMFVLGGFAGNASTTLRNALILLPFAVYIGRWGCSLLRSSSWFPRVQR